MALIPTPQEQEAIRRVRAVGHYSVRDLAKLFACSSRQVQKAIDPERRAELDRIHLKRYRARKKACLTLHRDGGCSTKAFSTGGRHQDER